MRRCALVLGVIVAACQPSGRPAQSAASDTVVPAEPTYDGPKACELVSAEEIKAVTGVAVSAGETVTDYMGDSQCRFQLANDTAASVMVTLHMEGKIDPYQKVPGSVPVSGLGDAAVWNAAVFQLAAASGSAVLSVAFLAMPAAKQSWATKLTRTALERLKAAGARSTAASRP